MQISAFPLVIQSQPQSRGKVNSSLIQERETKDPVLDSAAQQHVLEIKQELNEG